MPVIRLGVVGLGVISRFYLAAIASSPRFELAAVCDLDERALAGHRVPAHRSHRAMLDAGGVDAVVVTAPNDVHAAVVADAVERGLPVCVEKPLATTLRDGLAVAEAARARDVALFTAFHRRYNANVLALRDKLAGAPPIVELTVRYLERIEEHVGDDRWYLDPARSGGGCVADNGPNALDVARLFLGEVTLESARVTRVAGIDRRAVLHVRGTAPAVVELDWSHPGETKDVTARLADGTVLSADMLQGYEEFKGSLWHEYEGVLKDFASAVAARSAWRDGGLAALDLVDEVYRREGA
jgi:predicted dehydrogenase